MKNLNKQSIKKNKTNKTKQNGTNITHQLVPTV